MKLAQLRAFEKHLEGAFPNHFSPVYLILGKESFQRKNAVDKLVAALHRPQQTEELDVQSFQADRLSSFQLLHELNTLTLFAARRVLIIEEADKLDKDSISVLEKYFLQPTSDLFLILSAASLHHGTNFYKKGEKVGIVLEFQEEKSWEKERSMQEWIREAAAAEGKTIDLACCRQLINLLGTNQGLLTSELQKLVCYVGERKTITLQDISVMIAPIPSDTCWQLGEAIFRRDGAAALCISKDLLAGETPLIVLLRQLRSQFQTELQVSFILENEKNSEAVTKQFPYMKGNILERHIGYCQSYGLKRFLAGLLKIDETELQVKNSGLEATFLAELLMIKLTS